MKGNLLQRILRKKTKLKIQPHNEETSSEMSGTTFLDPTRSHPTEILEKIFGYVCFGGVIIPPVNNGYPWILGHVCSRWRQVLWGSVSIWKNIIIHRPLFGFYSPARQLTQNISPTQYPIIVRGALENILSHFSTPVELVVLNSDALEHVRPIIYEHRDQISALTLKWVDNRSLYHLLCDCPGPLSALESLSVNMVWDYDRNPSPGMNDTTPLLTIAPNLRRMTYDTSYNPIVPLLALPWAKIEEIHITGEAAISPDMVYDILKSAPQLISCTFGIIAVQAFDVPHIIFLHALANLELRFGWQVPYDIHRFFQPITTPSLESLSITALMVYEHTLTSHITRSRCSLRNLRLIGQYGGGSKEHYFAPLLGYLYLMDTITVSWCFPVSLIRQMHAGHFPSLTKAIFSVYPDGLGAFLDILDAYVNGEHSPGWRFAFFDVKLCNGPRFVENKERYISGYKAYKTIRGLRVRVYNELTRSYIKGEREKAYDYLGITTFPRKI